MSGIPTILCSFVAVLTDAVPQKGLGLNGIVTLVASLVGLPAAIFGLFQLLRFLRARSREEPPGVAELEKEREYLSALREYLEDLDRPLGYTQAEYTPLPGSFVGEDYISRQFALRKSLSVDQVGLSPTDILSTAPTKRVHDVSRFLKRSKRPVILLGDPGAGKSVTVRQMAAEIANYELKHKHTWGAVPIYLQLGAYHQCTDEGEPVPVIDFVRDQLKNVIPCGQNIESSLDVILRKQRAVLLLDSMDEMPSHDFSKRAEKLKSFLIAYGGHNQIIVACRKREYTGSFPHSELVLEPFSQRSVKEYLERQWKLFSSMLSEEAREGSREAYMRMANPEHALYHFATNPFSLKLLTRYFFSKNGVLPQSRPEIFNSYIQERLLREGQRRGLNDLQQKNALSVWKALAFGVIDENLGTYTHEDELHGGIRALASLSPQVIDDAVSIAVTSGLIRREKDNSIRFEHHRLLEYLAATYVEEKRAAQTLGPEQLRNPWWREIVALLAGITSDADVLIEQIYRSIDPSYLKALGFKLESSDQADSAPSDPRTERLENLALVELAFVCARQRYSELNENSGTRLSDLAIGISLNGSVLEKVRLVRAVSGIPLDARADLLADLANTTSDWLIEEIIESVDRSDYESAEFSKILAAILRSVPSTELIDRLRAVKGLSLSMLLRSKDLSARKLLWGLLGRVVLYWTCLVALMVVGGFLNYKFNPTEAGKGDNPWALMLFPSVWAAVLLYFAGLRTGAFLIIGFGAVALALPPRSVFRLFMIVTLTFVFIGFDYKRARWIQNRFRRAMSLLLSMNHFVRVYLLWFAIDSLVILGYLYYRLGIGLYGWLGQMKTISIGWQRCLYSIPLAIAIEILITVSQRRRLDALLRQSATLVDPENVGQYVSRCIEKLRGGLSRQMSKRVLDRLVELPADEAIVIDALKQFADSGEFLLKPDDILESIDRVDLRRKQKALGSPSAGRVHKTSSVDAAASSSATSVS